jgi:predicted nucleotidyltransferase
LRRYAEESLKKGAIAVFLIGSLARGDYTAFSDADVVLVVNDNYPKRYPDRISDFIDPTLPIDVEPRVHTISELLELARRRSGLIKEILKYGVLLAGDSGLLTVIRSVWSE